jgi:hypothetical protein
VTFCLFTVGLSSSSTTVVFFFFLSPIPFTLAAALLVPPFLSNPPVGVAISFGVLCALAGESESLMYPTELFENTLSASLTAAFRRPAPGPPPAALPEIVPVAPPVVVGLKVLDFM